MLTKTESVAAAIAKTYLRIYSHIIQKQEALTLLVMILIR
jgi:hypothetical protein